METLIESCSKDTLLCLLLSSESLVSIHLLRFSSCSWFSKPTDLPFYFPNLMQVSFIRGSCTRTHMRSRKCHQASRLCSQEECRKAAGSMLKHQHQAQVEPTGNSSTFHLFSIVKLDPSGPDGSSMTQHLNLLFLWTNQAFPEPPRGLIIFSLWHFHSISKTIRQMHTQTFLLKLVESFS